MARPKGTKNVMRSPEEKRLIIIESQKFGIKKTARKYGVDNRLLVKWTKKYQANGLEGLVNHTGQNGFVKCGQLKGLQSKKNKTKEEELELENLKLKIEVARLKKGYLVKGVGTKKEFVTIKD